MMRAPLLVVLLTLLAGSFSCYNSFDPDRSSGLTMANLNWSDPNTWVGGTGASATVLSGGLPAATAEITIDAGVTVCVDVDTADLGMVNISGTLTADDTVDVELTADGIMVNNGGLLEIGTEASPFQHKFIFTINGMDPGFQTAAAVGRSDNGLTGNAMMPAARGIMAMTGGSISLFGAVPHRTKTKIDEHAPAGTRRLTLVDPVDWKQGDKIAIAITDYYGYGETEVLEIAQDTFGQKGVKLTSPLQTFRWGRLQYVTSSGLSLTDDRSVTPTNDQIPTFLDERAEVVHLTRNIVIRAPDDAAWASGGDGSGNDSGLGFGVHTMIMRGAPVARANGVEFVRCGQSQRIERYGWHWHVMNYQGSTYSGPDLDPASHHVKNCTFYDSANRAVNIHGTCGVEVEETYAVKIRGHAFFMEDGSEERNSITDCVAMDVRSPAGKVLISGRNYHIDGGGSTGSNNALSRSGDRCIKGHDEEASGFWLTNPLNRVERNWAIECAGPGIWNSFTNQVFGLTAGATNSSGNPIIPENHHYTAFNDNVGHSCMEHGLKTRHGVGNEAGTILRANYYVHDKAADGVTDDIRPAVFRRNSSWKSNDNGYSNRVRNPNYHNWVMADNHGVDFTGATLRAPTSLGGDASELRNALMVGESLNNSNTFPSYKIPPFSTRRFARRGVASYHFQLNTYECTVVNYPLEIIDVHNYPRPGGRNEQKAGGGFISMGDNYLDSFESYYFMPGFQLINSSAGYVSPPPYFNGYPVHGVWPPSNGLTTSDDGVSDYIHHSLTSATEDFWGYWGPEKWYIVPNEPFFTHDMDSSAVPVDQHLGSSNLRTWTGHQTDTARTPIAEPNPFEAYAFSTPDRMFGIGSIRHRLMSGGDFPGPFNGSDRPIVMRFDRLNRTTLVSEDEYIVGAGDQSRNSGIDFGSIANNPASDTSQYMHTTFAFRHFGAMNHGYYKISFPGDPNATDTNLIQEFSVPTPSDVVSLITQNLYLPDDWIILCLPWDRSVTPYARYEYSQFTGSISVAVAAGRARQIDATGGSLQDVLNSLDGSVMWHDTANDELWVKLVGGLTPISGWISDAERSSLSRAHVENITPDEYKRKAFFQIRSTHQSTW